MKTAVEWYNSKVIELMKQREQGNIDVLEFRNQLDLLLTEAKEMEKEQELKIKIQCFKESLQFIDDNYMVELLNIRIYNMEQELETFKSE